MTAGGKSCKDIIFHFPFLRIHRVISELADKSSEEKGRPPSSFRSVRKTITTLIRRISSVRNVDGAGSAKRKCFCSEPNRGGFSPRSCLLFLFFFQFFFINVFLSPPLLSSTHFHWRKTTHKPIKLKNKTKNNTLILEQDAFMSCHSLMRRLLEQIPEM